MDNWTRLLHGKGYKTIQNSTLKSGPIKFPFIYIYTPVLKGNLWVHLTNLLSRKKQTNSYPGKKKGFKGYKTIQNSTP